MHKLLLGVAVLGGVALLGAPAQAGAVNPFSVKGTWKIDGNQSVGESPVIFSQTPSVVSACAYISGTIAGDAITGFYCKSTGRIVFARFSAGGPLAQVYQGMLADTGTTKRMAGTFAD